MVSFQSDPPHEDDRAYMQKVPSASRSESSPAWTQVVALWRDLLPGNTAESNQDAASSGKVVWFVRVGGYDTVTALLRTLLREKQAYQHHGWGGRLKSSDWRLAMHCCCDLLIAGGQTGKVWPQSNSSMFERAEAVCVPVDLLSCLVQVWPLLQHPPHSAQLSLAKSTHPVP